mmetsp:Transcript_9896/g.29915  ORF Transcript_9896/g.29915 Transcript_9896/m.29915 type:complete len:247 (-) Transcript_9896:413-1153(-)
MTGIMMGRLRRPRAGTDRSWARAAHALCCLAGARWQPCRCKVSRQRRGPPRCRRLSCSQRTWAFRLHLRAAPSGQKLPAFRLRSRPASAGQSLSAFRLNPRLACAGQTARCTHCAVMLQPFAQMARRCAKMGTQAIEPGARATPGMGVRAGLELLMNLGREAPTGMKAARVDAEATTARHLRCLARRRAVWSSAGQVGGRTPRPATAPRARLLTKGEWLWTGRRQQMPTSLRPPHPRQRLSQSWAA